MENSQALNVETNPLEINANAQINEEVLNAEEINESVKNRSLVSYFSSGEGLKKTVSIFGQSEEEIEKEFKNYKAQKVFNKLSYLILDTSLCKTALKKECETAVKYSFNSITVLPNIVSVAKSYVNKGVNVNAIISFPYGEDNISVKLKAVSKAISDGANGVTLPVSVTKIKSATFKTISQDFKKIVKKARKKEVNVLIDVSKLSPTELQTTINTLIEIKGITSIIPYETSREKTLDIATVKEIIKTANGKINVTVLGKISTAEETISVLSLGVNNILSDKCVSVVIDAIKKLNF